MLDIDNLIVEFLGDTISQSDRKKLEEWVGRSANNKKYYYQQCEIWLAAQEAFRAGKEYSAEYHRFNRRLQKQKRLKLRIVVSRYAAAIIFGALITSSIIFGINYIRDLEQIRHTQSIETPIGSRSRVVLADGTEVWLNAGSKLNYNNLFSKNNRNVSISGEAYFNVTHDKEMPFVVNVGDVSVRVLGTKFNVKSYSDDRYINITLAEGSVVVKRLKDDKEYQLKPSQMATYDRDRGDIVVTNIRPSTVLNWLDGSHFFNEYSLMEITKQLEKSFGVHFVFKNNEKRHLTFYADFDNTESLTDILEVLSSSNRFKYKTNDNTITIY